MNKMTEAEWRRAERRDPDKTYVEPELPPLHRYLMGRGAVVVCVVATLLASVAIVYQVYG